MNRGPDFIFLGPSKSGSTWIFQLLKSHPDTYVPPAKDIYFFDRFYSKGLDWYERFFQGAKPGQVVGELSHDYLMDHIALERIHKHYPDVKLICCLRDPFERAWSSYRYFARCGVSLSTLGDAIKKYPQIYREGLYYDHLTAVFRLFPRESVLVLDFDELKSDSEKFAGELTRFLGVSVDKIDDSVLNIVVNGAAEPRSVFIAKTAKAGALALRAVGMANLLGVIKQNRSVNALLFKTLTSAADVPCEEFPRYCIFEYNEQISLLEKLLGWELSKWKRRLEC